MLRWIVLAVVLVSASAWGKIIPQPPMPAACLKGGTGSVNCNDRPETINLYTEAPVFESAVKNGKRYLAGSGNDTFWVVHLYSDTDDLYEMGYALGQMFPKEIDDMFQKIEPWLEELLEQAVPWLPKWLADLVVEYGATAAIDLVYEITKNYIPADYLAEWKGMAAGAGCSERKIEHVSLFPQLSKAACTILVAHEKATTTGDVHHLRCLDFDPNSYVADWASVVIYHYKTKPQLANFAWVPMTGVLTGMNDVPMTVGEKEWGHNDPILPYGLPWMQMLRRSLELRNLTAVNAYITQHDSGKSPQPNTVAIHLGYGDQSSNSIIGYEVGFNYSKAFHWNTHRPSATHPIYDNVVYWSKNDPAKTMCVADMLKAEYGHLSAEFMAMSWSPNDKTGDTQMVAFDLGEMKAYVANSRKTGKDGPLCAYYRQRTLLDMKALFAETL